MRKEQLQNKLKTNLKFVSVLFGITAILFVNKVYQIYIASPTLIEIQENLIFRDYLVITLFISALLTFGLSIYYYFVLPSLSYKLQTIILLGTGILLFPYSLLLMLYGVMIMIDRPKLKNAGMYVIIFGGFIFIVFYMMLLVGFAEHKPVYVEATIYEFEYQSANETILFDVEVLHKEGALIQVNLSVDATVPSPELLDPQARQSIYQLSLGAPVSCYLLSTREGVTNEEFSCTMYPEDYLNFELDELLDFTQFVVMRGLIDTDQDIIATETVPLTLISEEVKENYYD